MCDNGRHRHGVSAVIRILTCVAPHTTPTGECSDPPDEPTEHPECRPVTSPADVAEPTPPQPPTRRTPKPQGPRPRRRRAAEIARDEILKRVADGTWSGDNYPVLTDMRKILHMGLHTLCEATRMLEAEGLLHKVAIPRPPGERGRHYVWRPVTVRSRGTEDEAQRLEKDIRSGRLAGQLPTITDAARARHINAKAVSEVYHRLQEDGVIDLVWLPDLSQRVWRVLDPEDRRVERAFIGDCRALVIAHDLIRRTPEWLVRRPRGDWARTFLPDIEPVRTEYRTHFGNAELALELLVLLGVAERRFVGSQRKYLPSPPSDEGAAFWLTFRKEAGYIGRDWFPVATTTNWLPLPTSKDDPIVADARVQAEQYRRHRTRKQRGPRRGAR